MNTSERSMKLRLAAHKSWAATPDRKSRTEAARKSSHHTRFIKQAKALHPTATDEQIKDVAESLKKAFYVENALKSAQARRIKSEAKKTAKRKALDAEMAAYAAGARVA